MKKTLKIQGMHCASCKAVIEDVARETKGVKDCTVDAAKGTATVEYEGSVDWQALKKEIERLGNYKVQ